MTNGRERQPFEATNPAMLALESAKRNQTLVLRVKSPDSKKANLLIGLSP
jgi:hypothetical protein